MDALETEPANEQVEPATVNKSLVIRNRLGLHARAAAKLALALESFKAEVFFAHEDLEADARSVLSLLSLGCAYNSKVVLQAAGEDAHDAVSTLSAIIEDKFGEE
jgi:phosphotransferase system HPr (HPr) family protein